MSSIIYRFLPVKVRTNLLDIYIYEEGNFVIWSYGYLEQSG